MVDFVERLPSNRTWAGRLLRLPLRLLPPGAVVPILTGPCAGMKWVIGSGPTSCWLGIAEVAKHRLLGQTIAAGSVFLDVGANVGTYTMQGSRLCGPGGRVIAFEPAPRNVAFLERHIRLNGLTNVTIIEAALSDRDDSARFTTTPDRVTSHLSADGEIEVACWRLDTLVMQKRVPPPDCIKIDVEGAECSVLRGAEAVLSGSTGPRPTVFVATHGESNKAECESILDDIGYDVRSIAGLEDEFIARPRPR